MKTVSFSITQVNRLRQAAVKAREIPPEKTHRDGSASLVSASASDLLHVFDTLWLKQGFALYAYAYRVDIGGNGRIWAVPADSVPVASNGSPKAGDEWMRRPPGSVPLMQAIDGDGSPWSYLSASILSREAAEFGAWWHGCEWTDQAIVAGVPRHAEDPDVLGDSWELTEGGPVGEWDWCAPVPHNWQPTFRDTGTTKEVVLNIYNPLGQEHIYQSTDIYPAGTYSAKTETTELCWGKGGFVY